MIGYQEAILILAILLLVFGPTKLPKIARELGKAWHEFNKASSGLIETVSSAPTAKDEDKNKLLLEVARKLDVKSQEKTDEQLTKEKHLPIIKIERLNNNKHLIIIDVGEGKHPNEIDHWIQWIELRIDDLYIGRANLVQK